MQHPAMMMMPRPSLNGYPHPHPQVMMPRGKMVPMMMTPMMMTAPDPYQQQHSAVFGYHDPHPRVMMPSGKMVPMMMTAPDPHQQQHSAVNFGCGFPPPMFYPYPLTMMAPYDSHPFPEYNGEDNGDDKHEHQQESADYDNDNDNDEDQYEDEQQPELSDNLGPNKDPSTTENNQPQDKVHEVPRVSLSPAPVVIVDDKVEPVVRQPDQKVPSPIGSERPYHARWGNTKPRPVQKVIATGPVVSYPRQQTLVERIEKSDGNNLPELERHHDLEKCQKCQQRSPHRQGMRYCSDCFRTLRFCLNHGQCGMRTDQEHGYCNPCYYAFREVCVECGTQYYFDEMGLCKACTKKAAPIKRGECHTWWVDKTATGQPQRMVCREASGHRRYCRECWESQKTEEEEA